VIISSFSLNKLENWQTQIKLGRSTESNVWIGCCRR